MRGIPLRLGPKINLLLLLFIVIIGAATVVLLLFGFDRTQQNATDTSREGLERQGVDTLRRDAGVHSSVGQFQFFPAVEWGHQAAHFMASSSASVLPAVPHLTADARGNLHDASPDRATDVFVPAGVSLDAAMADLEASSPLATIFPSLMTDYPGRLTADDFRPIAIYFVGPSGARRYFPATGDMLRAEAAVTRDLNAIAGPAANPSRKSVWSAPYRDEARQTLVISAYTPVYAESGYLGVIGVDLSIARLVDQINSLRPTASGFAFYMDRDGNVLQTEASRLIEAALSEPGDGGFPGVASDMLAGRAGVDRVVLGGREMFVAYAPFSDVGGSFGLAAPVDEINQEADTVAAAIRSEGNRTVAFVLIDLAALLAIALVASAWLNRRVFIHPISALVSGTRAVAAGDFNASIPVRSNDELGDLALSFNRMIEEIRARNEALEREIAERERTTAALAEREEGFRNIFESTSDALFITTLDDRIVDANPAALQMYGYTLDELRALEPFALVHERSRANIPDYLGALSAGKPYRARAIQRRRDGSSFIAEVLGTHVTFQGSQHIMAVVRDVTEEAQQQRRLEQHVEERTRELRALLQVSSNVSSTLDLNELLALVLDQVREVIPYTGASLLAQEGDELVVRYARGPQSSHTTPIPATQRFPADYSNSVWLSLLHREPVMIHDVREDSELARDFRRLAGDQLDTTFSRVASWLALPMMRKGTFLGLIALSSDRPAAFSRREADLGMAIANQAAIAIENAGLFAEAERRAREMTALSLVATSLDLERSLKGTLDNLAQTVVESTGAIACSISTVTDDGHLLLGGTYGLPAGYLDAVRAGHERGAPRPNQRALRSGKPYVIRHAMAQTLAEPEYAALHQVIRGEPWDVVVIVPMQLGERDLGTIELYYLPGAEPDVREVSLVMAMSRQAATAIENAFLFDQTERRVRQLEAITRIAASFTLENTIEKLMDDIAGEVLNATGGAFVVITVSSGESIRPHRLVGFAGLPDHHRESIQEAFDVGAGSSADAAIDQHRPMFSPNIRLGRIEDPRYSPVGEMFAWETWDSVYMVPIVYRDRPRGVITVAYPGDSPPPREEAGFIEAIADQAALAIENARLYQRASAAAALEERQRLARELHDSVSQALYGIALGARTARRRLGDAAPAQIAEPLDYVLSLAEAGLTEMRALIFELRPESIATEGLIAAIGRQVAATQARYGITVDATLCDEPDLPIATKETVYRIAQESLHNTVKHARATRVDLSLACEGQALSLHIRDDGQGFDPSGDFPGHLGLQSMRERAQGIRATLHIESAPGAGTAITLTVPA